MIKKVQMVLLVSVLVLSLLAGCGNKAATDVSSTTLAGSTASEQASTQSGPPADSDKPVTLEYFTDTYEPENKMIQTLIDEYKNIAPNVTINYSIVPFEDYATKIAVLLSSRQPCDIINMYNSNIASYLDVLAEAPGYVVQDAKTNCPAAYKMNQINGKFYGYSYSDAHVMFVNKDMYAEAGLKYPKTWDELIAVNEAMSKIVKVDGKDVKKMGVNIWWAPEYSIAYLDNIVNALGGKMYTDDGKLNVANNAKVLEALKIFKKLSHKEDTFFNAFAQGNCATMFNCRWGISYVQDYGVKGLNFEVVQMPQGIDGKPVAEGYFQMWTVMNYRPKENQDAAWKFLHWQYNDENNYRLSTDGAIGEWRTSTMERLKKESPDKFGPTFEAGQYATSPLITPHWADIARIMGDWLEKVVMSDMAPEEALAGAQAEFDSAIAKK